MQNLPQMSNLVLPDSKQLDQFEQCLMKGVTPIEVCDFILKNTPEVFSLLRKKEKDRDDFLCKQLLA
jgi:hypothetical protein